MALSEETRQRLAEHAAKNKGRTTLAGLDQVLAGVALDFVQENDERCGRWVFRADGTIRYSEYPDPESHYASGLRGRYDEPKKLLSRHSLLLPWVRLSYAPDWLKTEFANRFPSRRIVFFTPGRATSDHVFPIGRVAEFFRFLWPEYSDYQPRMVKYLTGYSENYIQRWPGVGARVRMALDHPLYAGWEGRVSEVQPVEIEFENGTTYLGPQTRAFDWEVIG